MRGDVWVVRDTRAAPRLEAVQAAPPRDPARTRVAGDGRRRKPLEASA